MKAEGIDPGEHRKAVKATASELAANSFEVICREWLENKRCNIEEAQYQKAKARLEKDAFPWIGSRPIAEISAPEVLTVLRRIDARGARYTAHKVKSEISQCFRYAIATGRAERDPCPDLRGAIPAPKTENRPAITDRGCVETPQNAESLATAENECVSSNRLLVTMRAVKMGAFAPVFLKWSPHTS